MRPTCQEGGDADVGNKSWRQLELGRDHLNDSDRSGRGVPAADQDRRGHRDGEHGRDESCGDSQRLVAAALFAVRRSLFVEPCAYCGELGTVPEPWRAVAVPARLSRT
jgi:hypothetical protein